MARRRTVPAPLADVLAYRNADVVHRFVRDWQVSPKEANQIFKDLLRFLWATTRIARLNPPPIIDEMWHTFLVYSARYREFGMRYFGKPVDHEPRSLRQKRAVVKLWREARAQAAKRQAQALEREAAAVYDVLGPRVARRWYLDYGRRYDEAFFATPRPRRVPM